jgi:hypothetical protein
MIARGVRNLQRSILTSNMRDFGRGNNVENVGGQSGRDSAKRACRCLYPADSDIKTIRARIGCRLGP